MNPLQFFVQCKCLSDDLNSIERKKQSAKQKRARLSEKFEREQIIHQKAMEELHKFEKKEFENIVSITKSGSEYRFKDFLEMVDRIRKPFTCFIEGHEVSITQDDCAFMLEKSVMKKSQIHCFMVKSDSTHPVMKSNPKRNSNEETRLSTLKKEPPSSLHCIKQKTEMSIRMKPHLKSILMASSMC